MIRVLLVEDDPADARLVEAQLVSVNHDRFEVTRAKSLAEGIGALTESGADVVLLDLRLPDSHGLKTFEQLQRACPEVPVVVLSGLTDAKIATDAVHGGAQDFLVKDRAATAELVRVLRFAVERGRLQRERDAVIVQLRSALDEVKRLSSFLSMCASCKRVRDDDGRWSEVSAYISLHTDTKVSHGLCPNCAAEAHKALGKPEGSAVP